jgi:hypothetical protein
MPNVKYSGDKGIVQSSGTGGFSLSGVGLALDEETVVFNANKPISAVGVTKCTSDGDNRKGELGSPTTVSGAAGQTKLVLKTAAVGKVQLADANGDLNGQLLSAAGDFSFLVWTGTAWLPVASEIN